MTRPCGGSAPVCNGIACVSCGSQCRGNLCVVDISGAVSCSSGIPLPPQPCATCTSDASCAAGWTCVVNLLTLESYEALNAVYMPLPEGLRVCLKPNAV